MIKAKLIAAAIIVLGFLPSLLYPQMPPHPETAKKIRSGELQVPYTLKNLKAIRQRGVDASWASDELKLSKSSMESDRIYGPARKVAGDFRALVLLVDFDDKPARAKTRGFDSLLFSKGPGTLNHYFREISYGKINIVTVNLPGSIGWKRAPRSYSYYTDGQNGFGNYPRNVQKLVEDVVAIVDPQVDFSQYDNDNDGEVDALFIVHSGPGAEYTGSDNDIWSHAWVVANTQLRDGVQISRYSMEPEFWKSPGDMTVGVYAHELGHAGFGLPDLYDTDYTSEGLGNWSLMAGGSWNGANGNQPAHPDVWTRMQMGFITPVSITEDYLQLDIPPIQDTAIAYRIWKKGTSGPEYFLLENRKAKGYDKALPGEGLLIYHIDETAYSNDNEWYPGHTSSGNYLVALEQSDGLWQLERSSSGDMGDPFPGEGNIREFSSASLPASSAYRSGFTNMAVRNITPLGSNIRVEIDLEDNFVYKKSAIAFNAVEVNSIPDTLDLTLSNISGKVLNIDLQSRNSEFRIVNKTDFPRTLQPLDSFKVSVTFIPPSKGEYTDSIRVVTSNVQAPFYLPLSGRGFILSAMPENTLYASSISGKNGMILSLNSSSGAGNQIGEPGVNTFRSLSVSPVKKELFALSYQFNRSFLYRINSTEGDAYQTAQTSKVLMAIAFDNGGNLWGAGKDRALYRVDPLTGECIMIRTLGIAVSDMTFNPIDNTLWLSAGSGAAVKDLIFRFDPKSGDTINVGRTGLPNYLEGMAFNRQGELFGVYNSGDQSARLVKINTLNGVASEKGATGANLIRGLAIVSSDLWASASGEEINQAGGYSLGQNYPNPFNPVTTIDFSLPLRSFVEINIYDLLGRKVAGLVKGEMPAGKNSVRFNAAGFPSGLYIYSIKSGSFSQSRKMMVLK